MCISCILTLVIHNPNFLNSFFQQKTYYEIYSYTCSTTIEARRKGKCHLDSRQFGLQPRIFRVRIGPSYYNEMKCAATFISDLAFLFPYKWQRKKGSPLPFFYTEFYFFENKEVDVNTNAIQEKETKLWEEMVFVVCGGEWAKLQSIHETVTISKNLNQPFPTDLIVVQCWLSMLHHKSRFAFWASLVYWDCAGVANISKEGHKMW